MSKDKVKKKQIGCSHEDKWCYGFELKDGTLFDLCEECYNSLFKDLSIDAKERQEAIKYTKEKLGRK